MNGEEGEEEAGDPRASRGGGQHASADVHASLVASALDYFYDQCLEDFVRILLDADAGAHFSVAVDPLLLADASPPLAELLYTQPRAALRVLARGARLFMAHVLAESPQRARMVAKPHLHPRVAALDTPETFPRFLPKNEHVHRFLTVRGTVIRTGKVKMVEHRKQYTCGKCRAAFSVRADVEAYYALQKPTQCRARALAAKHGVCGGKSFAELPVTRDNCKDFQEIRIQEQVNRLEIGTIPGSLTVVLEDDLVDALKAGDDVLVTGTMIRRWKPPQQSGKLEIDVALLANSVAAAAGSGGSDGIELTEAVRAEFYRFWERYGQTPLTGRNRIVAAFCPQVYGLYVIKLAVLLTVIGGVQASHGKSGTRTRGEPHLLLVGDPGTGKSQFLKFAARLSARSILTTGIGTTTAGLTCAAVKEAGEWHLEAGALVLADHGLCCIDEFGSIREADKTAIHEAMEQQTLSVAKAGMVCKLNTQCSVIAATNPKGKYDPTQAITVNIALASPLLSRFDLVFVLLDGHNEEWDELVSAFILGNESAGGVAKRAERDGPPPMDSQPELEFDLATLRAYIHYVRHSFQPELTERASQVLSEYYQLQRSSDLKNSARTTLRMLEGMVRLSQAHARLCFRETVEVMDAVVVVMLLETSVMGAPVISPVTMNPMHTVWPQDAEHEYFRQEEAVLRQLGLKFD